MLTSVMLLIIARETFGISKEMKRDRDREKEIKREIEKEEREEEILGELVEEGKS